MAEKGLAEIVGSSRVLSGKDVLDEYSGDTSFVPPVRPDCVVRPENAAEVEAIVKWANGSRTPLVPVSSTGSHARGDTVPGVPDAVIVDLSSMKKIIRIDARNKVAMVEPGVTFGELQAALAEVGLTAYMPLAPRESKSVIGSMLEREPVTMPAHHWDSADPLLCVEVVFGSGDRFRTGEASGPDTVEEQWEMDRVQMNPFGHSHVDFHRLISGAQGTIGIVTWATLKCCYLSKLSRALLVPSAKLEPLVGLIYQPLKYRLGGKLLILNGLNLACLLGGSPEEIKKLVKDLPPWLLFVSFEGYGVLPEEKAAYEEADFRKMAASCGLKPQSEISGVKADDLNALLSRPSPGPYWKTKFKGAYQDIFFLTTLDKTPDFVAVMNKLSGQHDFPPENIGVYIQPIVQGTSCHCEFNLYYDDSAADVARGLMESAGVKLAEMRAFFSRPYAAWRDAAYRNAAGTAAMQKKVKDIFDPNGIVNPGKLCF
jgi:hypothetical protein